MAEPSERPSSPTNVLSFPKTIELEQRLARAELTIAELRSGAARKDAVIQELRDTTSALYRRVIALQAQLDHLLGKIAPF